MEDDRCLANSSRLVSVVFSDRDSIRSPLLGCGNEYAGNVEVKTSLSLYSGLWNKDLVGEKTNLVRVPCILYV